MEKKGEQKSNKNKVEIDIINSEINTETSALLPNQTPETISYLSAFINSVKQILFVSSSFSFSWGLVILTLLIGHLKEADENANPIEVAPLAVTLFEIMITIFMAVYFGLGQDLSPKFAKLNASKDEIQNDVNYQDLGAGYKRAMLWSFPLGIIISTPMIFSEEILLLLGQQPNIVAAAQRFTRVICLSSMPLLWRFITEQYILAAGKNKVAGIIAGSDLILGALLAGFLAFGPPNLGLRGIAAGFVIESILTMLAFSIYTRVQAPFSRIPFFSQWDLSVFKNMLHLVKTGYPFSLQYAGELSAGFATGLLAGRLGHAQLSSWHFAQALIFFTKIPSIAAGVTSLHAFGGTFKTDPISAVRIAYGYVLASFAIVAPFCLVNFIKPGWLIDLFSDSVSHHVRKLAGELLQIVSAGILVSAPTVIFMFVPKHVGDTKIPHVISILSAWGGVGLGWYLAEYRELGVNGLGIGFTVGRIVTLLGNGYRFFKQVNPKALENFNSGVTELTINLGKQEEQHEVNQRWLQFCLPCFKKN